MQIRRFITFTALFISLFLAAPAEAGMLRVVRIHDERTIVVDKGTPVPIQLSGVVITDAQGARAFLEWTLATAWITGEKRVDGYAVWRSPDGMFINRELVTRGYATATSVELEPSRNFSVIYVGELLPDAIRRAPAPVGKPARVTVPRGSGSGKPAPARARRSPRPRPAPGSPPARKD